ncbi:hypothetical protein M9458_007525 [Cirrhinus mrigala]|uniref:L1 transposable element RRM domain-containing protein n=1 Tax=Cirrhinus mrigala TaxID=683832 RepID=A0ABD0RLK6_CIRMR
MNKSKKTVKKAPSPTVNMVEDTSTSPVLTDANTCGPTNITYIKETTETEASHPLEGEDEASPRAILLAIRKMDFSMNARFNSLEASLSVVQLTLTANTSCIADLEEASTDYERRISHLEQLCSGLSLENTSLKAKVTDLEARSRRQNIKITGFPENIEKGNLTRFVSELLPSLLGGSNFPQGVKVDRAHRIGPIGNKPRVMIARIHHDSVKTEILQLSRGQSPLSFAGGRISIFPDFPVEVSTQRKQFDSVREKLRAKGIKYGLLYPANLILSHEKTKKIFSSPQEAESYIDSLSP